MRANLFLSSYSQTNCLSINKPNCKFFLTICQCIPIIEKKTNRQLVKQKISLEKYKLKVREQDGQGQLCI